MKTILLIIIMVTTFIQALSYGQYMQGKACMQQREFKLAEEHFHLSIRQDPPFIPSLTGLAALKIRAMNYFMVKSPEDKNIH